MTAGHGITHFNALLLVTLLLCCSLCVAGDDVVSIDVSTASYQFSSTTKPIHITLWFDFKIYQFTINPTSISETYSSTTFNKFIGTSECHKPNDNTVAEAKIMIENDDKIVVVFDKMTVYTASGAWYGIEGRCIDDELNNIQSWLYGNSYSDWIMDELRCDSGTSNIFMAIDNEMNDSGPFKQIFYFDTTRPNQYINDAQWMDGTTVIPHIITCDPTASPSVPPTPVPTHAASTTAPTMGTNAPTATTSAPTRSTAAPTVTTPAPTAITTTPTRTTPAPSETTAAPITSTTAPAMTATRTTAAPTTTTTAPTRTTAADDDDEEGQITSHDEPTWVFAAVASALLSGLLCLCLFCRLCRLRKAYKRDEETMGEDIDGGQRGSQQIDINRESNAEAGFVKWIEGKTTALAGEPEPTEEEIGVKINSNPEHDRIHQWLESCGVEYRPYPSVFIDNGYDSMNEIMAITSEEELSDIGVRLMGHRCFLLSEIEKLKTTTAGGNQIAMAPQESSMIQKQPQWNVSHSESDHNNDDLWDARQQRPSMAATAGTRGRII